METGWLIEFAGPLWLGVCSLKFKLVTASDAIRFARREDAEQLRAVMRTLEPNGVWGDATVSEHEWSDPKAERDELARMRDENARMREALYALQHAVWHALDDSEERKDEVAISLDNFNAIAALLPEDHPVSLGPQAGEKEASDAQ